MARKKIFVIENGAEVGKIVDLTPAEEAAFALPSPPPSESDMVQAFRELASEIGPAAVARIEARFGPQP